MQDRPESRGEGYFESDVNLQRILARAGLAEEHGRLAAFGAWVGGEVDAQADYTSRFAPPVLATYDRDGEVANRVEYNPRYAAAHRDAYRHGIVGLNYGAAPKPFLLTFAMGYLLSQADISIHCPVTLTGAVAYVIDRHAPAAVKDRYLADLVRTDGAAATGATWATELQGGSDLGATTTVARPAPGGVVLTGLKWFASNGDCDLALATARPENAPGGTKGLGLYLVPRRLDDGTLNHYRLRRLKDKLGTRGLATAEVDLLDAWAVEAAAPPGGLKVMMEALGYSRVHNAMAAAGVQRRAFVEASQYASQRQAFGHPLASYPMIQDTILDMLMQLEAGVALAFESARTFDAAQGDDDAATWSRVATALAKYQTAEQAVRAASSAIEVLGGNGYVEDYVTARLLRDAQVLTVWEGPPNIQALELLRLVTGRFTGLEAFEARIGALLAPAGGTLADLASPVRAGLDACRGAVAVVRDTADEGPRRARRILALMADTLAAALLLDEAAADLAEGDTRKALVAHRFIAAQLTDAQLRRVAMDDAWGGDYFPEVVGYQRVAAGDLSKGLRWHP